MTFKVKLSLCESEYNLSMPRKVIADENRMIKLALRQSKSLNFGKGTYKLLFQILKEKAYK